MHTFTLQARYLICLVLRDGTVAGRIPAGSVGGGQLHIGTLAVLLHIPTNSSKNATIVRYFAQNVIQLDCANMRKEQ
jgi:hypothetical protein